jgi:PAS domain S-box-containing protein
MVLPARGRALPRGDELFRALIEHAADIVAVLGPDGSISYISPAVERLLGHRPEELIGRDALDGVHPEDQVALVTALAAPQGTVVALRLGRRDGSFRRFGVSVTDRTEDPVIQGFLLSAREADGTPRAPAVPGPQAAQPASADAMSGLGRDLAGAMERCELRLDYQPSVDLKTGALVGMEALARWQHPHLGPIGPDRFIPLAEETGLILPLGRWALAEACRQARIWQATYPRLGNLVMGVNVSPRQFEHPHLVDEVAEALARSGIAPASLRLEITENAVLGHDEAAIRTLIALRRLGVQLALDDFGTGYSSLTYLRRLPVDTLKIDQSFVQELGTNATSEAIVRAVIALAHALGMNVTAEGFETATQLARLRDAYCDHGQGYYFSKPLPVGQMDELLASISG